MLWRIRMEFVLESSDMDLKYRFRVFPLKVPRITQQMSPYSCILPCANLLQLTILFCCILILFMSGPHRAIHYTDTSMDTHIYFTTQHISTHPSGRAEAEPMTEASGDNSSMIMLAREARLSQIRGHGNVRRSELRASGSFRFLHPFYMSLPIPTRFFLVESFAFSYSIAATW